MLQAREFACILLLLASALLVADGYAQDMENAGEDQQIQRLGDIPVNPEVTLDPKVPTGQEPQATEPETEAERAARVQLERERTLHRLFAEAGKAMKEELSLIHI